MKPIRVLIVEDDTSSAFTINKMLVDEGYDIVATATSGEEAVTLALAESPDIVLMDIGIEGEMDGVEAADAMLKVSEMPIVYITGYQDAETVERAKRTNPFGYLVKPFTKNELAITIQVAVYKHEVDRRLRESELRLSTILSNIPSGVFYTDAQERVVYMNPQAEVFTQQSLERTRGKLIWELLDLREVQTDDALTDARKLLFERRKTSAHLRPVRLVSASGEQRVVETWGASIPDAAGSVHGYVVTLRDVTVQYEAELRARTLAAALESLDDGVVITSTYQERKEPRVLYVNDGFTKLTGWTRGESVEQPLSFLWPKQQDESFLTLMRSQLRKGLPFSGETSNARRDGQEFICQWSAAAVTDAEGEAAQLVFILRNVTHVRRLEENIRQSQKIEAVGRLAGGIAHDFNNLLSVINSYSDLIALKLEGDSPIKRYAGQIRAAGRKGADLVSQLMTYSRRERPQPVNLSLAEVVYEVQSMLRRVIRENIELKTDLPKEVPAVKADRGQLDQILMNLCLNARDAMPNGGKITVSVRTQEVEGESTKEAPFMRPGRYAVLAVEDSGCGMDAETMKHIFDPFFTTKKIGEGTGLGLSTVYGIMKQVGGWPEVKSEVGKGTRFDLFFPIAKQEAGEGEEGEELAPAATGTEAVLVVEDDETFLDCITGLLSLHGYEVYAAADGLEAMERLTELKKHVKLLVTDLVLPKVSGREVAKRLRELNPEAKVIYMTGYDDQLEAPFPAEEDSVLLEKPFPLNTLLIKVRELADAERPVAG